jgi:hypothetical protein
MFKHTESACRYLQFPLRIRGQGQLSPEEKRMSYQTEFPNFDDAASCERLLSLGFTDMSWGNDACPSFERDGVSLYVDYADASLSEFTNRGAERFTVIWDANTEAVSFADIEWALIYHSHSVMSDLPTPQVLGDEFINFLGGWLTDYEMGEIQRRNATPAYAACCASHDFCDAKCELDLAKPAHLDLCNAAWEYARAKYMTAQVI